MKTEAFSGLTCFQTPGLFQRIKLRTEAVASVVNFRTVQNFQPVWSEGEQAGLGRPVASAAVPKIPGLMKRHMK